MVKTHVDFWMAQFTSHVCHRLAGRFRERDREKGTQNIHSRFGGIVLFIGPSELPLSQPDSSYVRLSGLPQMKIRKQKWTSSFNFVAPTIKKNWMERKGKQIPNTGQRLFLWSLLALSSRKPEDNRLSILDWPFTIVVGAAKCLASRYHSVVENTHQT